MRIRLLSLCLLAIVAPFCSGCNSKPNQEKIIYSDGREEVNKNPTIDSLTENGEEVSILPEEWMKYYKNNKDFKNVVSYYTEGVENCSPESFTVRWTNQNTTSKYSFLLADNKNMDNPVSYDLKEQACELKDLFAGTHYYYVIKALYEDRTVISRRFDFKTVDYFRTIKIDGVFNGRDLGNKKTNNGKQRVKQGLIYRTANFDGVTNKGKTQDLEQYGIKTDLDLREKGPISSPLGPEVNYVNNGVGEYGSPFYISQTTGVNVQNYQVAMRDNLKVLANKDNYPLAFHCAVGRDRTGTFAITLYLLLGINQDQIRQDYVVSWFSKACNNGIFESYVEYMESLFKYYSNYKPEGIKDNSSIYERVEAYCLHIGLSKDEINSIRNILLEDIKK